MRIDSQKTPDRGWASVPEAVTLPDSRVRLYYVSDGLDVKHGIVSAISDDGLSFTREETRLTGFVDPAVVSLDDGNYLMLAVAFPYSSAGKLTDAAPGIYSFISQDGINFEDRQLVLAGEGNIDPAIIDSGGGSFRVYYWNIMDQPSVIRSISGKTVSNSSVASSPAPPVIVPVMAARSIAGAKVWLFAVDDGNPQLAVSAESDGKLLMGRLDVTDPEPAQPDNPLLHRDDVIVTPHIAAGTRAGKDRIYEIAITQVLQLLRGERPPNLINSEVWKD